jgi:hypothetical protein
MPPRSSIFGLALASLAACGGSEPPLSQAFAGAPLLSLTTTTGLSLSVRTSPQPPTRGNDAAEFTFGGGAVEGLRLTVIPWMPDMGHGTSQAPMVTEVGGGVYRIDRLALFMAGRWQLRTRIGGPVNDDVVPEFQIP